MSACIAYVGFVIIICTKSVSVDAMANTTVIAFVFVNRTFNCTHSIAHSDS